MLCISPSPPEGPSLPLAPPSEPGLVPRGMASLFATNSTEFAQPALQVWQFILKKEALNQDVFLIGAPGLLKRRLVLAYAELAHREVELLTITQDTTVHDITQRREILNGTSLFNDGPAVKAALHGRILVLDGIEKAERNVLSTLNNLCENREVHLEDGRFLTSPARYDALMRDASIDKQRMAASAATDDVRMVRVDPRFRVICLGVPVPTYEGRPLDPPFRSRFQCLDLHRCDVFYPAVAASDDALRRLAGVGETMELAATVGVEGLSARQLHRARFPSDFAPAARAILAVFQRASPLFLATSLYPVPLLPSTDAALRNLAVEAMERWRIGSAQELAHMGPRFTHAFNYALARPVDAAGRALFVCGADEVAVKLAMGPGGAPDDAPFVPLAYHEAVVGNLLAMHALGRPLVATLVGPRGSGKTVLAKRLSQLVRYPVFFFPLHRDVTSNDLLMRRATRPNGDTVWLPSPLVLAAIKGALCVLDGIDAVPASTLASLASLLCDGEMPLPDGTRLSRSSADASRRTHERFRVVCLGRSENAGARAGASAWMSQEVLATLAPFVPLRALHTDEEAAVLRHFYPRPASPRADGDVELLVALAHVLRSRDDDEARALAANLSTRQLVRAARRLVSDDGAVVGALVENACLFRFLPALAKDVLHAAMVHVGMPLPVHKPVSASLKAEVVRLDKPVVTPAGRTQVAWLRIGASAQAAVLEPRNEEERSLVPDTLFFDNPRQADTLASMLVDFEMGEPMLLMGNQGTGKNKLVDRMLHLLALPREYIQLGAHVPPWLPACRARTYALTPGGAQTATAA